MNNKSLDLTFARLVQEKRELAERNARAIAYSREVAQRKQRKANKINEIKEIIGMFFGGLSVFVLIFAMYFVGVMFV